MQLELFKRSVKYSRVSSGIHSIAEAPQNFDDNISSSGESLLHPVRYVIISFYPKPASELSLRYSADYYKSRAVP